MKGNGDRDEKWVTQYSYILYDSDDRRPGMPRLDQAVDRERSKKNAHRERIVSIYQL